MQVTREFSAGGVVVRRMHGRWWLPLDDAPRLLAYGGEREMAEKARAALAL